MKSASIARIATFLVAGSFLTHWPSRAAEEQKKLEDKPATKDSIGPVERDNQKKYARLLNALDTKTEIEFTVTPLSLAMDYFKDRHKIDIELDMPRLKELGLDSTSAEVTMNVKGIRLRSALKLLLDPLKLAYLVQRNGTLLITTKQNAEDILEARVYDVRDLATCGGKQTADYDPLIEVITSIISPSNWSDLGGPATIASISGGSLVIDHTQYAHEEIKQLLGAMRRAIEANNQGKFEPLGLVDESVEQAVHRAMQREFKVNLKETPLNLAVDYLRHLSETEIQFDGVALKEAGIEPSARRVSLKEERTNLRSALGTILSDEDDRLTTIIKNDVLLITTGPGPVEMLEIRMYPIADLVKDARQSEIDEHPQAVDAVDELIEVIETTIAASTWSDLGGPGEIRSFEPNCPILVVRQTQAVQEQIADLLAQLRAVRKKQQEEETAQPAKPLEPEKMELRVYMLRTERPPQPAKAATEQKSQPKDDKTKPADPAVMGQIGRNYGGPSTTQTPAMPPGEVLQVVVALVEPESWREKDAYIDAVTGRLIVRQTPSVHRKIEKLLRQLGVLESVATERLEQRNVPVNSGGFGGGF